MSTNTWRRINKIQTFVILPLAVIILFSHSLRSSIGLLMGISLWTWWLGALAAWRADEPDE